MLQAKGYVSDETFDEFLASLGILEMCEDQAIEEINVEFVNNSLELTHAPLQYSANGPT